MIPKPLTGAVVGGSLTLLIKTVSVPPAGKRAVFVKKTLISVKVVMIVVR